MSLTGFIQNVTAFIIGPFGISLIVVAFAITCLLAMADWIRKSRVFEVLLLGAAAYAASTLVQQFIG